MVFYVRQGEMPDSRHTYMDSSRIYKEELFGEESFDGPYSLVYHLGEPTRVASIRREDKPRIDAENSEELRHRHFLSFNISRSGDFIRGRRYILFNDKVSLGVIKPSEITGNLFRHAISEQVFFVHRGNGILKSMLGDLEFSTGDYVYVPKGTTYSIEYSDDAEFFFVESDERISIPPRYLNIYGQIKEGAPYYTRDIRYPKLGKPDNSNGSYTVLVDYKSHYLIEERDRNPFDVVGWDGYLYPFAISSDAMAPIVGKLHQPPPVHETFSSKSFMIGTFLPRKFDFHPKSIPISYYHSNVDTDEVLFYSSGNFMSRKGIEPGSVTLHVRGLIHGPQPGTLEQSIGKEGTDEVAVMVETYGQLKVASDGFKVEDTEYMQSWYQ